MVKLTRAIDTSPHGCIEGEVHQVSEMRMTWVVDRFYMCLVAGRIVILAVDMKMFRFIRLHRSCPNMICNHRPIRFSIILRYPPHLVQS